MEEHGPSTGHTPVLLREVLALLNVSAGQTVVDATVGLAGHALELCERVGPTGVVVALDQDELSLSAARTRLRGDNIRWVVGNFRNLESILARLGTGPVDALLADLGVSSPQLDVPERGFSFRTEGPLDMRMDPSMSEPAWQLVSRLSARELARIFWEYGEERFSRRIAARIVDERKKSPIETTTQLAELVRRSIPAPRGRQTIDPATRVFQALRIAVNDELGALDDLLAVLPRCIKPNGRAAIISFHSLEDRRVKRAFRNQDIWEVLTKKPVVAGPEELAQNPRSRSAKLRVARRR